MQLNIYLMIQPTMNTILRFFKKPLYCVACWLYHQNFWEFLFWDITKDLKNKVTDGDNIDPRLSFFIISSLYFYTACMHFVSLEF